jgi:N-acetylglucosamine-6-phosphate deacetylase
MNIKIGMEDKVIGCINCITGKAEEVSFKNGRLMSISERETKENDLPFIAPGLTDLQINGINGIDFNTTTLTREDVANATHYLLSQGVTTFLPTVITNSDDNIITLAHAIYMRHASLILL